MLRLLIVIPFISVIRGHKLHAKIASFPWKGNEDKLKLRSNQNINVKKPTQFVAVSSKAELSKEAPVIGVVSYAEIVGGRRNNNATLCRDNAADPNRDSGRSSNPLIEVNETDTEWLGLCAVGKRLHYHDNSFIQDLFTIHGIRDAQIRSWGGLNTLISFKSHESLEELLSLKNVWKQWFSDINKWNGMDFIPSRCVWLSCLGVPPNIWNNQVFTSIGNLWGEVIHIDELTANSLAFDKGRVFIVTERVVTTISVKKCHCMDSNELEENVRSKDGVEENEGRDLVKNIQSKENGYSDNKSMNARDESKIDGSPSGCELSPITELQDGINDCANSYVGERVVEGTNLNFKFQNSSSRAVESVVGDTCFDSISGVGESNLAWEDGEIAAKNITPLLGVDTAIHDLASDVREFDKEFWNLSEVGFLNQVDMEVVELNPAPVKSIDLLEDQSTEVVHLALI
ncbi:hypothetical protein RHGRI_011729 [Rhododendron griersonianum]|uniref:DUF4283 domain-containing protein n=1 Tax=Rhododendron griersonianum TaxID=479676 RepID=A0AAV6KN03_9ERIC|nr:hypothetical protein RHGRI_011729 [Rhododendron griersonianum]